MTAAPVAGLVGRCIVRSRSRAGAAPFGDLAPGVLDRVLIGRGAYLVVRRIAVDAASIGERDEALATGVAEAARAAARPCLGHVPSDAVAVLFHDHAEMVATMLLDVARGVADHHWWWTHLDVPVAGRVAAAMLDHVTAVPAALALLDAWGCGDEVLAAMSDGDVAAVADALEHTHVHPTMHEARTTAGSRGRTTIVGGDAPAGDVPPRRTAPGQRRTTGGVPQPARLARIRKVIAAQHPFSVPEPERPASTAGTGSHRDSSTELMATESRHHGAHTRAGPAAMTAGAARHPERTVHARGMRPASVPAPTEPPYRVDHPGGSEQGGPASGDKPRTTPPPSESVARQPPGTLPRSRRSATGDDSPTAPLTPKQVVPRPRGTDARSGESVDAATSHPFATQLAGSFYLVGGMRAIDSSTPAPWGHARWALLAAIVLRLVGEVPDPLWQFLRDLAAYPDLGEPFPPPDLAVQADAARGSIAEAVDLDEEHLAELVATPGIVDATSTHIDVLIPLERISMAARVRGLDADPGWCPEFGRVIRFHFEDA